MRILMIAGNFEPSGGAASILTTRTAIRLAARGHEVTVLTAHLEGDSDRFAGGSVPGLQVIRDEGRRQLLRRVVKKVWGRAVSRWPSWVHIPDRKFDWALFSAAQVQKAMEASQPDVIYSRSYPFASHLIAGRLRRATSVPWVAHFGDPLVGHPYLKMNPVTKRINLRLERRIYRTADALIFTNRVQQDLMLGPDSAELAGKSHIMPPYFDPSDAGAQRPPAADPKRSAVVFAHVGRLYGLRSPEGLLRALALLRAQDGQANQISVVFVGKLGNFMPEHGRTGDKAIANLIRHLRLQDAVQIVGEVSYAESLRWMAEADVLVSIDAPVDGVSPFVPSKLAPYAATGKPLLNLTPAGSASAQFTSEVGGITAPPDNPELIASAIRALVASRDEDFRPFRPKPEGLQRLTISAVQNHLESILSNAVGSSTSDEGLARRERMCTCGEGPRTTRQASI